MLFVVFVVFVVFVGFVVRSFLRAPRASALSALSADSKRGRRVDSISRRVSGPELAARVGQEAGVSSWTLIDQARIDAFADVTEDWQFIHVDPARAKATPFGGTIAHGFLVLSLLSKMAYEVAPQIEGLQIAVNYGFDRIRFLHPVRSGERVRARFRLAEAAEKDAGRWLIRYTVTVEIEDSPRAALVADWLSLQIVAG